MSATTIAMGRDRREDAPFKTSGEFLEAVQTSTVSNRIDPRLRPLAVAGLDEQGEYSDPFGGYMAPTSLAPTVLDRSAGSDDPFEGRTQPVKMTSSTVSVNARVDQDHTSSASGGLVVRRHAETFDVPASRFAMEQVTLMSHEAMGLTFASERVVSDSFPSFAAVLGAAYRAEFAAVFLEERLRGSGVGEMLGILKSPALIVAAKESGQAAKTVVGDNVVSMRARCWGYRRAVWVANQELAPQLMKCTVSVGTGGSALPLWSPGSEADGIPDRLAGRPIYYTDRASAIGDVGDLMIVNPNEYLDGTWVPFEYASSIHVRFAAVERAFRFMVRNAGAPWWRSPLTPKYGTATLSPYITLEAR